ncbi:hypothetical protein RJT34_25523 [Clitoria ternatea]|uniref:DUF1639 family protein n=1 Tax=Clitoria ternatea TaxID=43366 RepID=A0AAN9FS60_CLITE
MVFTGSGEEEDNVHNMAMGPERSKPLHNFMLPCLKWGSQRHLKCMKLPSDDAGDRRSPARNGELEAAPSNAERRTRLTKARFLGDEGIDAVREKLMLDLKTETDRMKDAILGKEVAVVTAEDERNAAEVAAAVEDEAAGVRSWNLRSRRGLGKESGGNGNGNGNGNGKGLRIEEKRGSGSSSLSPLRTHNGAVKSPFNLRGSPEKTERPKFSLTLSKKEIEEDFIKMLGHRPPRRPKKRNRNVQKQLDTLFPGMWLSEVSADSYKVPDVPENNGKR